MAQRPMVTPQTMTAPAPIDAPYRTLVGTIRQRSRGLPSGEIARGRRSLVKTAQGPTKTPSSIVTPSYTDTPFWIFTPSPIFTRASI